MENKNKEYRNIRDLFSLEGIYVEKGSLWKHDPDLDLLVLVDEDQFATFPFSEAEEEFVFS